MATSAWDDFDSRVEARFSPEEIAAAEASVERHVMDLPLTDAERETLVEALSLYSKRWPEDITTQVLLARLDLG